LVIYIAEDRTLWADDMLSDSEIPYVNHNLAAYEASLTMLAALDIAVLAGCRRSRLKREMPSIQVLSLPKT
jgi:hypothetical protein